MTWFAGWASVLNLFLFHWPFFHFVFQHVDHSSMNGMIILVSLLILMLLVNFFVFFIIFSLSQWVGRVLLVLFFMLNSIAVYFINTYGIIIDESMVGNVFNTNFEESSSFFSIKLIVYIHILGVLTSVYILRATLENISWKSFFKITSLSLLLIVTIAFANSKNWLWIDKNSKTLGGLAMPWS